MRGTATVAEHCRNRLDTWYGQIQAVPWWGQCVGLWLIVLLVLTTVGLVSVRILDLREGYVPSMGVRPDSIPGIWTRWDSGYYIGLAGRGYRAMPQAVGFFPLYPMLMAGLSRITGMNLATSGMLIAQASYLAAILLFYKLARLIQDDHGFAMRSVICMLLFPSSLFFFAIYAEPLSMAFSILGVYLLLRTRPSYVWAGLALGISSVARPVGWLLDIVLLVEFLQRRKYNLASLASLLLGGLLSIAGIVAYVFYLYTITGSFFAITEAQSGWQAQLQFPWITYWKSVRVALFGTHVPDDWFLYVMNWIDLAFITGALALVAVAGWRSLKHRFRWSLTIYLLASSAFLLMQQRLDVAPIWGMTRWVAAQFPIYLILGNLSHRRAIQWSTALISGLLLLVFTGWWISGRWVG